MNKLVELSPKTHKNLKIHAQRAMNTAAKQQSLSLKVSEISQAASNFPVFFMPNIATGGWSVTALTSFVAATNLFLQGDIWQATYLPVCVKTYPFFLIDAEGGGYTVGIDTECDALSVENGTPLFEENDQPAPHVNQITKILDSELQNTFQTAQFIEHLEKLKLLKAIDLIVRYEDDTSQNMSGLHTIDEDVLSLLKGEELETLNKKGYLVQIHAMLISLYQMNSLIQKNNATSTFDKIKNVKFQVTRNRN